MKKIRSRRIGIYTIEEWSWLGDLIVWVNGRRSLRTFEKEQSEIESFYS